jgi:hypothetical protein
MLLPGGLAFGPLPFARTIEFRPFAKGTIALRPILTRSRKPRTLSPAAILAWPVTPGLVKAPRSLPRRALIASCPIVAPLPRFPVAVVWASGEILARTAIARKSFFTVALRTITGRPVATRAFTLFPETVITRWTGSFIAELLVRKPPGRTRVAAISTVVALPITGVAIAITRVALAITRVAIAITQLAVATRGKWPISARPIIAMEFRPVAILSTRRFLVVAAERPTFSLAAERTFRAFALSAK